MKPIQSSTERMSSASANVQRMQIKELCILWRTHRTPQTETRNILGEARLTMEREGSSRISELDRMQALHA
jgi:hypothetical protein